MGTDVAGPYYRSAEGAFDLPQNLRWIKGGWRNYTEFHFGYGVDVHHEWATALTLAEYLEAQDAE